MNNRLTELQQQFEALGRQLNALAPTDPRRLALILERADLVVMMEGELQKNVGGPTPD